MLIIDIFSFSIFNLSHSLYGRGFGMDEETHLFIWAMQHCLHMILTNSKFTSSWKHTEFVGLRHIFLFYSLLFEWQCRLTLFCSNILQQILQAVNTIHEERIVHSDLKPANFLLVKGSLKLIDFGIAKAIMSDTTNIQRDSQVDFTYSLYLVFQTIIRFRSMIASECRFHLVCALLLIDHVLPLRTRPSFVLCIFGWRGLLNCQFSLFKRFFS
jgi:serine/threonine protein kinase